MERQIGEGNPLKASPMKRAISLLSLITFLTTNHFAAPLSAYAAPAEPVVPQAVFPLEPGSIRIPEEIGKIEETFKGAGGQTVILVQNAHAVADAQKNIRKIIEHFQKQYGLGLVAVEGAGSALDAQIFKSFPDKELLQRVFSVYLEKEELTGVEAAALFSSENGNQTVYQGVEDWPLYEEGLGLYGAAAKNQPQLLEKLSARQKEIQSQKGKIYSKKLLEIDKALHAFRENHNDLIQVLRLLSQAKAPEEGTQLALLIEEGARGETAGASIEIEVKRLAEKVRTSLRGGRRPTKQSREIASPSARNDMLRAFHEKLQGFRTSRVAPQAFALFLKELIAEKHLPFKVSNQLSYLAANQKRMRDIEGTKLFRDFEHYAREVKESLFRNQRERGLNKESRKLELLGKLIRLELSREEWTEIKSEIASLPPGLTARRAGDTAFARNDVAVKSVIASPFRGEAISQFSELLNAHFSFYENAVKRDETMFQNLLRHMDLSLRANVVSEAISHAGLLRPAFPPQRRRIRPLADGRPRNDSVALLVAGGFHTEGLTQRLKEKNISYVLLTPQINSIPEKTHYREHMQGEVSWKNYFRVENGKVNFYKAFVRAARDKLLAAASKEEKVDSPVLKNWRDQIIRDLVKQGKAASAGKYTAFLDETLKGGENKLLAEKFAKIDSFIEKLRALGGKDQLTGHNILKLLQPSTIETPAGTKLFPDLSVRVSALHRGAELDVKSALKKIPTTAYTSIVENVGARSGVPSVRSGLRTLVYSEQSVPRAEMRMENLSSVTPEPNEPRFAEERFRRELPPLTLDQAGSSRSEMRAEDGFILTVAAVVLVSGAIGMLTTHVRTWLRRRNGAPPAEGTVSNGNSEGTLRASRSELPSVRSELRTLVSSEPSVSRAELRGKGKGEGHWFPGKIKTVVASMILSVLYGGFAAGQIGQQSKAAPKRKTPATVASTNEPSYRFAHRYNAQDLLDNKGTVRRYLRELTEWEGRFHQPGIAYNAKSGITYDGHNIDFNTGELIGTPRNWSASSKEANQIGMLTLVMDGDEEAKIFTDYAHTEQAAKKAIEILERKITSYENFNKKYPGFGGFLPWILVSDEGMEPTHDWQDRVPLLDNVELFWREIALEYVLRQKGHTRLADRYQAHINQMIRNVVMIFYDGNGRIRAEAKIRNTKANPALANYSNNIAGYFLDDPYEGDLAAWIFEFYTNLNPSEKNKIWEYKRKKLEAVDYPTPKGPITGKKGHWLSSHEEWGKLDFPYLDVPIVRRVFVNTEKIRTWDAAINGRPGLLASVSGVLDRADAPIPVNIYISAAGVQAAARQRVERTDVLAPYAAFPVIAVDTIVREIDPALQAGPFGVGVVWLDLVLDGPRMQGPYGASESVNTKGTAFGPFLTWDNKVLTVVAARGGVVRYVREVLKKQGHYNRAIALLEREYKLAFPVLKGEDLPFAEPTAVIPMTLGDFKVMTPAEMARDRVDILKGTAYQGEGVLFDSHQFKNGVLYLPEGNGYIWNQIKQVELKKNFVLNLDIKTSREGRVFLEVKNTDDKLVSAQKIAVNVPNTNGKRQIISLDLSKVITNKNKPAGIFVFSDPGVSMEVYGGIFDSQPSESSRKLEWDGRRFVVPEIKKEKTGRAEDKSAVKIANVLESVNFQKGGNINYQHEKTLRLATSGGWIWGYMPKTDIEKKPYLVVEAVSNGGTVWVELKNSRDQHLVGKKRFNIPKVNLTFPNTKGEKQTVVFDLSKQIIPEVTDTTAAIVAFSDPTGTTEIFVMGFADAQGIKDIKPARSEARRKLKTLEEISGAKDWDSSKRMQNEQVFVPSDKISDAAGVGAFEKNIVPQITANKDASLGTDPKPVSLDQIKEPGDFGLGHQNTQGRTAQDVDKLGQEFRGKDRNQLAVQKGIVDTARRRTMQESGNKNIGINGDPDAHARTVPDELSHTIAGFRDEKGGVWQTARASSKPKAPNAPRASDARVSGPSVIWQGYPVDRQVAPPAVRPVWRGAQQLSFASASPDAQDTLVKDPRQAHRSEVRRDSEEFDKRVDAEAGVANQGSQSTTVQNAVIGNGQMNFAPFLDKDNVGAKPPERSAGFWKGLNRLRPGNNGEFGYLNGNSKDTGGGFSDFLKRFFIHHDETGTNGVANITPDNSKGRPLADTAGNRRAFGNIAKIFTTADQNSKLYNLRSPFFQKSSISPPGASRSLSASSRSEVRVETRQDAWFDEFREVLRNGGFGDQADKLLPQDLFSLRVAEPTEKILKLYAGVLGVTVQPDLVQNLKAWNYPQQVSPQFLEDAILDFRRNRNDADTFRQAIANFRKVARDVLTQEIPRDSMVHHAVSRYFEYATPTPYTQSQIQILETVAQRLYTAFIPEGIDWKELPEIEPAFAQLSQTMDRGTVSDAADLMSLRDRWTSAWIQRTVPSSLDLMFEYLFNRYPPVEPIRMQYVLIDWQAMIEYNTGRIGYVMPWNSPMPKLFVISRFDYLANELTQEQFGSVAANLYGYSALMLMGSPVWHRFGLDDQGEGAVNWIAESAGILIGHWLAADHGNAENFVPASGKLGPTLLMQLYKRGKEIASQPVDTWAKELQTYEFPESETWNGQGALLAGIATEIAQQVQAENIHQTALDFIGYFAANARTVGFSELARLSAQYLKEPSRSEVRKPSRRDFLKFAAAGGVLPVPKSLRNILGALEGIITGRSNRKMSEREADGVAVYIRYAGYNQLTEALKQITILRNAVTTSHVPGLHVAFNEESQALSDTLTLPKDSKAPGLQGTISLVLPKTADDSLVPNFMKALSQASINTVAIVGKGKPADDVAKIAKSHRIKVRLVRELKELKGEEVPVPTGIYDQPFSQIPENWIVPFKIEMGNVNDPLVKDYVEQFQIVALIHTARILAAEKNPASLLRQPDELRKKLLASLAHSGRDYSSLIGWTQSGFVISALEAKFFLQHRSELRIKQAA